MNRTKSYFFCGIGGSGMLPLASIVRAQGQEVKGSDRALDQGRIATKFDYLRAQGIELFPQDGSGMTSGFQTLVTSAAVEDTIPDVIKARSLSAKELRRADLLAELFNAAPTSIGVAGTSGKSTVTGMIGWILHTIGRRPTVMNGAVMKNFARDDAPFASALVGDDSYFVSEIDESDGSIALFDPRIAVLNNISLDHKSMEELRSLFGNFIGKAECAVLNLDNEEVAKLAAILPEERVLSFGIDRRNAYLRAEDLVEAPDGIAFTAIEKADGTSVRVSLGVPGRHNVSNALAALGAVRACGVSLAQAAEAIGGFAGLSRRMDIVGSAKGVTVIDDFGHNPDKIAATLSTLHAFPGRLLILFQPHGYGPLKVMKDELIATFAEHLAADDVLIMPDPVYYGGTTDRSIGTADIIAGVKAQGRQAEHVAERFAAGARLVTLAEAGDRIIIMGARDDTLTQFAAEVLAAL
ncbi:UDP-N-acetylmuramate--L-alanine ligase [Sphingomonas cavernae]|uniref:UDP-N-acetylmuramate--alanine ligase n=1 Tax=Sphingomonas cavernae TaxID=2320861 RepID=A0A418W782_9SPHN|nr:Mur ligase family protein [Sphingomonas cavernae]RJF85828.1 UDP-N-acetylmuramate--alanine ligase [Sphingomonas cavernae]